MKEEIIYRPCLPGDVTIAARLIYSSGPDAFDYVFKNDKNTAIQFLENAFITPGGEFGYDHHHAVTLGDEMIGIGTIFSAKKAASFPLSDFAKIIKTYKWKTLSTTLRGLKVESIIKPPKKNEYALCHIAISEKYRSRGYGQKLMEHLMSTITLEEHQRYILDVSEENPKAKSLYDRMGFATTEHNISSLKSDFGYVPNHFRMAKS